MRKRVLSTTVLLAILILSSALPVLADGPVYFNPDRDDGNEDGSLLNPYDTITETEAYAQSLEDGAAIYQVDDDGNLTYLRYVDPVYSGAGGVPLPRLVLYVALAILALALMLLGWQMNRRAGRLRG